MDGATSRFPRLRAWSGGLRPGSGALVWVYALTIAGALQLAGVRPDHLPWWIGFGAVAGCWLVAYALAVGTVSWWRERAQGSRS